MAGTEADPGKANFVLRVSDRKVGSTPLRGVLIGPTAGNTGGSNPENLCCAPINHWHGEKSCAGPSIIEARLKTPLTLATDKLSQRQVVSLEWSAPVFRQVADMSAVIAFNQQCPLHRSSRVVNSLASDGTSTEAVKNLQNQRYHALVNSIQT